MKVESFQWEVEGFSVKVERFQWKVETFSVNVEQPADKVEPVRFISRCHVKSRTFQRKCGTATQESRTEHL